MTTTSPTFEHDPFAQAYPEQLAFWQAAEEGRLLLRTCRHCNKPHWYPRAICPLCGKDDLEWREASGQGNIYAYSVVKHPEEPYVVAYVRLQEGPTLLTNIHTANPEGLSIDQPVRVSFKRATEGRCMPVFVPVDD